MSQSTLALQRFGEGEDIILPEVQKKLIENTARLHTITLLRYALIVFPQIDLLAAIITVKLFKLGFETMKHFIR